MTTFTSAKIRGKMDRNGSNSSYNTSSSDVSEDSDSEDEYDDGDDDDGGDNDREEDDDGSAHNPVVGDGSVHLPKYTAKAYMWAREAQFRTSRNGIRTQEAAAETQAKYRKLPQDFGLRSNISITSAFKLFKWQSGTEQNPIPALGSLSNPKENFAKNEDVRRFYKAKQVVNLMEEIIDLEEEGRKLSHAFATVPTYRTLNELAEYGSRKFGEWLPETSSRRKRPRVQNMAISTASNLVKRIRNRLVDTSRS